MLAKNEKVKIYSIIKKILFVRKDIANKISNLSNINIVNVPIFMCRGSGWECKYKCWHQPILMIKIIINTSLSC